MARIDDIIEVLSDVREKHGNLRVVDGDGVNLHEAIVDTGTVGSVTYSDGTHEKREPSRFLRLIWREEDVADPEGDSGHEEGP